jgi:sporulation protein YlmC with PRC-barrel domain
MQRILSSTAVLAFLLGAGTALAPVQAQNNSNTAPQPGAPAVEGDCTGAAANTERCKTQSNAPAGNDNAAQNNNDTMSTGTTTPSTDSSAATPPANESGSANTAGVPAGTQFLASQFIGRTVYSSANENVGEINDLVMNKDLDTIVAIVGVGGFLGMGEKDVAIPIDQITITADSSTSTTGTGTSTTPENATTGTATTTPKLTIAMTREELDKAPAFDRTALAR